MGEADSFGLVGIASTGAILGVLITGFFLNVDKLSGALPEAEISASNLFEMYSSKLPAIAWDSFLSLLPIIIVYILFGSLLQFKHKRKRIIDLTRGIVLTYSGLVIFLLGVNGGFMDLGAQIGFGLPHWIQSPAFDRSFAAWPFHGAGRAGGPGTDPPG